MSDLSKCAVCKGDASRGYVLSAIPEDYTLAFCSKVHLVEFAAPEISKAVVVSQWMMPPEPIGHTAVEVKRYEPTPEESENMSQ